MKKKRYELTQLHIGKGAEFTAKFGDEQHYNMVRMSRERRYGQPVGNIRISWASTTTDADETMKLAQTLEAVSKAATTLNMRLIDQGLSDGVERVLAAHGFDVDAAMKW